jgi:hypothetical protein
MTLHASKGTPCCPVVELRQYTLKPGRREDLIDVFDRYLVEGQESVGMTVIGQFRDRRRPDRFVWLRGFPNMEARRKALEAFYDGPVWGAHKDAANDTMLEFDDVLLLRPARPDTAFRLDAAMTADSAPATVLAGICRMPVPADVGLVAQFERRIAPVLQEADIRIEAIFVTEPAPNTFARLPVREGENLLAWFGIVEGRERSPDWLEALASAANPDHPPVSLLELEPTSRSVLGHVPRAASGLKHEGR